MTDFVDQYLQEARKQGYHFKKFVYDYEKYKQDQEVKTKLEQRHEFLKVKYYLPCNNSFIIEQSC